MANNCIVPWLWVSEGYIGDNLSRPHAERRKEWVHPQKGGAHKDIYPYKAYPRFYPKTGKTIWHVYKVGKTVEHKKKFIKGGFLSEEAAITYIKKELLTCQDCGIIVENGGKNEGQVEGRRDGRAKE